MPVLLLARRRARRLAVRAFAASALALGAVALLCPGGARADEPAPWWQAEHAELYGRADLETTGFAEPGAFAGQRRGGVSVALEPTLLAEWNDGATVLTVTPFLRVDSADDARSHADIREFALDHVSGAWSATVGVDRVFWGRTEAVHLVDIVNQTDRVDNIDEETALGQPMLRVARLTDLGEVALFYLPYARARTLPGPEGRLRGAVPFATGRAEFEPAAGQWAPSVAARFSGVFGAVDLGLSAFHGVSRDPSFRFDPGEAGGRLVPVYSRITQAGIDLQVTAGATLWKAEAIVREGQRDLAFERQSYAAVTGGLEHTLYGVLDSAADLGLILEGAYDSRGSRALSVFENDVILGARLTLNDVSDTAVLLTGSIDTETGAAGLRLEAERRLSPVLTAAIEAQAFLNAPATGLDASLADDSFVRLTLSYYF